MKPLVFLFAAISILFAGCSKTTENIPVQETGIISGTIKIYDDKTNAFTNASGVTVTIIGDQDKIAVTAADGKFSIAGLPYDNYDLSFSKTGYGTFKIFGLEHQKQPNTPAGAVSTTQISRVINLGAVSTSTITSLNAIDANFNGVPGIEYTYSIFPVPGSSNRGYTRAFLGKNKIISPNNYDAASEIKSVISNNAIGGFTAEDLYGLGFNSGDSVYVKIYGESFYSNEYTEPATGKRIFPNLNAISAEAVGFKVP
jgi:hypothetical protein